MTSPCLAPSDARPLILSGSICRKPDAANGLRLDILAKDRLTRSHIIDRQPDTVDASQAVDSDLGPTDNREQP